jgi:hypothetical protein
MSSHGRTRAAATSTLDVLWVLYDQVLRVTSETVDDPHRDRFLLSKGHGPMAYYATLAAKGFFPVGWLAGDAEMDEGSDATGTPRTTSAPTGWTRQGFAARSPGSSASARPPEDYRPPQVLYCPSSTRCQMISSRHAPST